MSMNRQHMKWYKIFFAMPGYITACVAQFFLLKTNVEIFNNAGFASGFFEGKPRGKNTNKNTSEKN